MTTPPLADQQRANIIARHHHTTDPEACGTCRDLTTARKPAIHPECLRRATLAPAWDAPDYEDLVDLNEEERAALPARFHTPVYIESATPKSWNCAVCWGDGWVTRWPCETATAQGHRVFVPERYAGQSQQDLDTLLTDRDRLAAELDAARQRAVTAEATIERMERTNRMVNGGARDARERAERAEAELDAARAERDAFADRLDTLTTVAKGNRRHVQEMYTDLLKAQAELATAGVEAERLRGELAIARAQARDARNAALTEGAQLIREHRGDLDADAPWWDTRDQAVAAALLLAARTAT